jgi:hypothetical protein
MQWQTEQRLHKSSVINIVTKRQNKQDMKYDKAWLCQTTTGNNEIRGFSDQGGETVVVAASTSGSITLPFFPSVLLFVKEQKLEHFKEQKEGGESWLLPSNA